MDDEERTYIDNLPIDANGLRRWVKTEHGFEGRCDRCKVVTEVWKYYSIFDGYLQLCLYDIYQYENIISKHAKNGKIYTRHPAAPWIKSKRRRRWDFSLLECESCKSQVSVHGYSKLNEEGNYYFLGVCSNCEAKIEGFTYDLQQKSKDLLHANKEKESFKESATRKIEEVSASKAAKNSSVHPRLQEIIAVKLEKERLRREARAKKSKEYRDKKN